jgi:hypothetical protein
MSFDISRLTFNPLNDYSGVVMQQGRVHLDSDWNEWLAELTRRMQAGTLDILGRAVYPATTPYAFQITASSSGGSNVLTIGPGRMYVDGLIVENHGDPTTAVWDPALAEMSNSPQPPPATETGAIDYTQQPYMPAGSTLPSGNGPFLAYLDVWIRPIDYINDPNLIDAAVGVDSTGRLQTVWQVQLKDLSEDGPGATWTCDSPISNWPPAPSAGQLTTGTTPTAPSGPCCLTSGAAYTGLENQCYRIQIHQAGTPETSAVPPTNLANGIATFKWSRDNGSVITAVTSIANVTNSAGNPASQLTVQSLGRDQVLGFAPGNWIEILDDSTEFSQTPVELYRIDTIDFAAKTITLATTLGAGFLAGDTDPSLHTRIRRWDQSGKVYEQDGSTVWWDIDAQGTADIPVPPAGTSLILENGITVSFDLRSATGRFNPGDFWTFAARTATGQIEKLDKAAPRGIHHHYARLSIVSFPNSATDCRTEWPPSTGQSECGCCCTCTVGDGVNTFGKYTSINKAIDALPDFGGEVCILPGLYFENVLIHGRRDVVLRGCGWQTRIASESLKPAPPPADPAVGAEHAPAGAGGANTDSPPFAAVITISQSQHVKLLSFAVEATEDEVGVLIDGTGKLSAASQSNTSVLNVLRERIIIKPIPTLDVTVEDLVITASTVPAILADTASLLQIESNRIAMENVAARWPAMWVSGNEIRIVHNWVGIQPKDTVAGADLNAEQNPSRGAAVITSDVPLHPGGIQIAARATDVYVIDNEIDGGGLNGITLGSLTTTNSDGNETGQVIGVLVNQPDPCSTTSTLQIGGSGSGSQTGLTVVAGGPLKDIQIERNRIRNMGLCGIGPAGFFDLSEITEVISVTNLEITANTIQRTLLSSITPSASGNSQIGYGAICLPDVQNVMVRDNTITDFGQQPGGAVCGIYILRGEMIEINRNQVNESRTWDEASSVEEQQGVPRGGIFVTFATPPAFSSTANTAGFATIYEEASVPLYQPAMPALRVEHNVVRVPLNVTLYALGIGPFSIVDNHLSCGGTVASGPFEIADTVLIMNLGIGIDIAGLFSTFKQSDKFALMDSASFRTSQRTLPLGGTVLFTNNVCQLEKVTGQFALASVVILSLDQIVFSNNQCWVDGDSAALVDAALVAGTVQVTSNRFQESLLPLAAFYSGITLGLLSVTADNISTLCLLAIAPPTSRVYANNISLAPLFPESENICGNWGQP